MQNLRKFPKSSENGRVKHCYEFGPFRVDPGKRLLLRGGEPVSLTPKAFEILLLLVERQGEVLLKEELMESIWRDTVVEEGNLNRNISTLRKVLGESPSDHRYIVTVPGHGYRFVADVEEAGEAHRQPTERESRALDSARAGPNSVDSVDGPIQSLAVLPLENLSGDPEQEYFADG